jgi:hypothetical protein
MPIMNEKLATDLLRRYCSGDCTNAEMQLVEAWYNELINTGDLEWEEGEEDSMQMSIETGLIQNMATDDVPLAPVRRLHVSSGTWWAAAILVIVAGGGLFSK